MKMRQVPFTAAALRYFLRALGLAPAKGKAATKLAYFKEFFEAFEQNKPPKLEPAQVKAQLKRQKTKIVSRSS